MPGRRGNQYDDAFALLEKSFNDSSFMKAYQSLPVKQEEERVMRPAMAKLWTSTTDATTPTGQLEDDDTVNDDDDHDGASDDGSMHEGYGDKVTPPIALSRSNVSLPPTPPTQTRERSSDTAHLVPLPPAQQESGLSTPVHQQSPPTPDLTPPTTRNKGLYPPRPAMAQFPSSRAESFVTAREAPSIVSAATSQLSLPLAETPAGRGWLDATRSMRLGGTGIDAGGSDEEGDGNVTPTRQKSRLSLRQQNSNVTAAHQKSSVEFAHESDNSDTSSKIFMRNVTIRKKRRKPELETSERQLQLQPQENGQTLREEKASAPEGLETTEAAPEHSERLDARLMEAVNSDEAERSMAINDMLYRAIRDEKSKRLSGVSHTSTVIEAMVIAGPQQKKRILRHAGKNLALREDLSSTRTSIDSAGLDDHAHSLRHKRAHIPYRRDVLKDEARDGKRAVSNPERQRRERVQVIVIPERRTSLVQKASPQLRRQGETHLLTDQQPQQQNLHHSKPNAALLLAESESGHGRPSFDDQLAVHSPLSLSVVAPKSSSRGGPVRLRHVSAPLPSNYRTTRPSRSDALRSAKGESTQLGLGPKDTWTEHGNHAMDTKSSTAEDALALHSQSPLLDRSSADTPDSHTYYTANNTLDSTPLKQPVDSASTVAPFNHNHTSPSTRRSSDHSNLNPRYLHPSRTPGSLSQFSDQSVDSNVNEARAIPLFPHGNNSLLLVQHISSQPRARNGRLDGIDTDRTAPIAIDEVSTPTTACTDDSPTQPGSLRPIFTATLDEPATPPGQRRDVGREDHSPGEEDNGIAKGVYNSPLTNPRAAPMPPVIIIPPTPSPAPQSVDQSHPISTKINRPGMERRQSLVEKARRYSESFIQPFLPTNTTRRRTVSDEHRPTSEHDRNLTLHPFWRPRGFWDDFTSSDSESDFDFDDELGPGERLPAGGDTSDVESLEQRKRGFSNVKWPRKMSVRMPGFRGQGGFLVGNSLGIERHGTNSRRPYIPSFSRNEASAGVPVREDRGDEEESGWLRGGEKPARGQVHRQKHKRTLSSPTFRSLPFFASTGTTINIRNTTDKNTAPGGIRKKRSQDLLNSVTYSTESLRQRALRQRPSQRSLRRRRAGGAFKAVKIPGTNLNFQVLSVAEIRERMGRKHLEKEERRKERAWEERRNEMRGKISGPTTLQS